MENQELHYLTYDPRAILNDMLDAYFAAGGKGIYPGDEKEILLQGMLQMFVQSFAGIDNALRMGTLRYAVRDYLDVIGENRDCARIEATAAKSEITITAAASEEGATIPEGTAVTSDGTLIWLTDEDVEIDPAGGSYNVGITCAETGEKGNGLLNGTPMQFVAAMSVSCVLACCENAAGGLNREKDEAYRERIRRHGLAETNAGPRELYESIAMAADSQIIDAKALNGGAGVVNVYLLLDEDAVSADIIAKVEAALNDETVRPLTDTVVVAECTDLSYTIEVQYQAGTSVNEEAIAQAIAEYQEWQDNEIGKAFNPDMLKALMYQAGAVRVIFTENSSFDGGECEYTEIEANERCSGTISAEVITA